LDVGLDSDSESFDEKVLEGDTFQWKVLPSTDQPIELTTFTNSSAKHEEAEAKPQEVDSDDDLPPLIDPSSDEEDQEDENEEGSTTSGYSDRELEQDSEGVEESESEDENQPEEYRVLVRTSEEYPGLIRFLFFLFLILHLINHAILLKEKREYEKNPCFRFHY
jgi:hypothetical protein